MAENDTQGGWVLPDGWGVERRHFEGAQWVEGRHFERAQQPVLSVVEGSREISESQEIPRLHSASLGMTGEKEWTLAENDAQGGWMLPDGRGVEGRHFERAQQPVLSVVEGSREISESQEIPRLHSASLRFARNDGEEGVNVG